MTRAMLLLILIMPGLLLAQTQEKEDVWAPPSAPHR